MSCDCHIYLPPNVRLKDVVDVLAILVGMPKKKVMLESKTHPAAWYLKTEGVEVEPSGSSPELMTIQATLPDGPAKTARGKNGDRMMAFWHWEPSSKPGWRLISVRTTAFWIAVGKNLVDFFGGVVDYNDCDDNYEDYKRHAKPHRMNCPESDEPWQRFQKRMWAVKPLTDKDFDAEENNAVYK